MCVVKPFEIAESFMEQHGRKAPLPELKLLFSCCQHVDPLDPRNAALVFQNYPAAWLRHYSASGLCRSDPVFRFADERMVPFHWSDPEFRASLSEAQREILSGAAGYGIVNGYTVPIRPPGAQTASCSVVPGSSSAISPATGQAVFVMASFMFDAMLRAKSEYSASRSIVLSEREPDVGAVPRGRWSDRPHLLKLCFISALAQLHRARVSTDGVHSQRGKPPLCRRRCHMPARQG
jgi:hypothetical protein